MLACVSNEMYWVLALHVMTRPFSCVSAKSSSMVGGIAVLDLVANSIRLYVVALIIKCALPPRRVIMVHARGSQRIWENTQAGHSNTKGIVNKCTA